MIAPTMPGHHGRSGHESDKLPYSKTAARLAMQFQIGQELKARYEVPQDHLPHGMLTLLMRLKELIEGTVRRRMTRARREAAD